MGIGAVVRLCFGDRAAHGKLRAVAWTGGLEVFSVKCETEIYLLGVKAEVDISPV